MIRRRAVALLVTLAALITLGRVARAEAPREIALANAAASTGDWPRVQQLLAPLATLQIALADRAEVERLSGLAAYFQNQPDAEAHFLAFLRIDPDGSLDPLLYPPEALAFLEGVKTRHRAEIQAQRPHGKRYVLLNLLPMAGQFQNGERGKGYVVGGLLGGFIVGDLTTFFILKSWCSQTSGDGGPGATCDKGSNHFHAATELRTANLLFGVGAIVTYVYGVYDGVTRYRARSRELSIQQSISPWASTTDRGSVLGIAGSF